MALQVRESLEQTLSVRAYDTIYIVPIQKLHKVLNSRKLSFSLITISLLLASTILLSSAVDFMSPVPSLNPLLKDYSSVRSFPDSFFIDNFFDQTELSELDLSIRGSTGTRYLRSNVYEEYTQGTWLSTPKEEKPYGGERLPPQVSDFTSRKKYTVEIVPRIKGFDNIPVFLNTRSISLHDGVIYHPNYQTFFIERGISTTYQVEYSQYIYSKDLLAGAIVSPLDYYVPEELEKKIKPLAIQVTSRNETHYAKIKALETYLKENYEYNLNSPQTPIGVDPIEWFLFGSGEGSCSHFNSALALLIRSIGLPARLVGGYLIDSDKDLQFVMPSQRHAYAEVLFEGLGWVTFDATGAGGTGTDAEDSTDGEEDAEVCEIEGGCFNRTEATDAVELTIELSPECGACQNIDLFTIYGVTKTGYLRTMVGEHYNGTWKLNDPSPEPYNGETSTYGVSSFNTSTSNAFDVTPIASMGGFVPTTLHTNSLSLEWELSYYREHQIFFSPRVFNTSYTVSHTKYEYSESQLQGAVPAYDSAYLNVPVGLLEKLLPLAQNITAQHSTPYEKLKALEQHLKAAYTYDVNYTRSPPDIDPVEWFLFHEKRGVCSQFNSAFVLLARSIGLPARLVAGYGISATAEVQTVNARQRHAYAEVLFEGLGWVTFDATGAGGTGTDAEDSTDGEEDAEVCEIEGGCFNRTEATDAVELTIELSPECGACQNIDLFTIYGVTKTGYLRTMVGEHYNGTWKLNDPELLSYKGGYISYPVSRHSDATINYLIIKPIEIMGGFLPIPLYTNEVKASWELSRYTNELLLFSPLKFNSSFLLSYTRYNFSEEVLKDASPLFDSQYLGISESLLTRFKPLALSITTNSETPYEKLKALEQHLKAAYTYDVNYTRSPPDIDPVEWFLFHEKRGVCSQFNSAFVLLARSIGLPARLVAGYGISATAEVQTVNARQRHAYAEVLFEGLGWVTFDATGAGGTSEPDEETNPLFKKPTVTTITDQDSIGIRGLTFNVQGEVKRVGGKSLSGLTTLIYLAERKNETGIIVGKGKVVNGTFNIICELPLNITNGEYFVKAKTLENEEYRESWSDPPLTVVTKTKMEFDLPEKFIAGRVFQFQGNLTNWFTGDPIPNATCLLDTGEEQIQLITNQNGILSGNYSLATPGTHTLTLSWSGSTYYLGSLESPEIKIIPLSITNDKLDNAVRLEKTVFSGKVHAEELPGDREAVVIYLNDTNIGTTFTDHNGKYSYEYTIPSTQRLGETTVTYKLVNNSAQNSHYLTIYARTLITIDAPSFSRTEDPFTISVQLLDDLENPIQNAPLSEIFQVLDEVNASEAQTDRDGRYKSIQKFSNLKETTKLTYNITFPGLDFYLASTNSASIHLLYFTITVNIPDIWIRLEEITVIGVVHAMEIPGSIESLQVKLNGTIIGSTTTDEEGNFEFEYFITREQGLGTAEIEFTLTSNSFQAIQEIKVMARTKISVEATDYAYNSEPLTLLILLTDDLERSLPSKNVTLQYDVESFNNTSLESLDNEGTLRIPLDLSWVESPCTFSYEASYEGQGYYLGSSKEGSIEIRMPPVNNILLLFPQFLRNYLPHIVITVITISGSGYYLYLRRKKGPVSIAFKPPSLIRKKTIDGRIKTSTQISIEFPNIVSPFPPVWGLNDDILVRTTLMSLEGEQLGGYQLTITIDEKKENVVTNDEGISELTWKFPTKGLRTIQVEKVEDDEYLGSQQIREIKIVEYREEIIELYNNLFESHKLIREEIKDYFTARDFMSVMVKYSENLGYNPIDEMITIFEIADYSEHDINRDKYETFYITRERCEEDKNGSREN